jgi:hypothetical protein
MTTTNLSTERASDTDIQQVIDSTEKGTTMFVPSRAFYLMAKELKALREAAEKPIGWTDAEELRDVEKDGCGNLFTANPITPTADPRRVIKLYAAPQLPAEPVSQSYKLPGNTE